MYFTHHCRARKRIEANRAAARALREEMARKDAERRRQREETMARLAKQAEKVEAGIKAAAASTTDFLMLV